MNQTTSEGHLLPAITIGEIIIISMGALHYITHLILHIWPQSITSKCCRVEFQNNKDVQIDPPPPIASL